MFEEGTTNLLKDPHFFQVIILEEINSRKYYNLQNKDCASTAKLARASRMMHS